ncbi:MAG: hypothetical protein C4516_00210 [Oxalobacter sp.]|nr:MAG: hypothetical protein C4516_00210 [Oxalobacter sp.]
MSAGIRKHFLQYANLCCAFWGVLLIAGCASGPTQQALQASKETFKAGDVKRSLQGFESAYRSQSNKDTPYYLEKGYLLRLLGDESLSQSSLTLLEADKVVSDWEAQARTDLARSSLDFMNYFFSFIQSSATYELKDFEKSMLSYTLAVNHVLAGRMDLAGVEARKMAQREKLIEALHEKKITALRAKKEQGDSGATSRVEDIKGYPIHVIRSPEINALKNAYQSAAAHYLAGFIFESQGEKGLAAAGYRLAAELKPDVKLFRESLGKLDASSLDNGSYADTLIIVETGHVPRVYSQKLTYPIPTMRGYRLVTVRLPVIDAYQSFFQVNNLQVGDKAVNLVQATNLDTMVRRQLKDEMPGYLLKATTQAISQVVAQEVAYHAGKAGMSKGNRNDGAAAAAMVGSLAALAAGAAMSAGDVDVRAWTTLPGAIYIGRRRFEKGEKKIVIPSPAGTSGANVVLKKDYELVYVRVLGNGAIVLNGAPSDVTRAYLKMPQASKPESAPAILSGFSFSDNLAERKVESGKTESLAPQSTEKQVTEKDNSTPKKVNCQNSSGFNKFMGLFGGKKEAPSDKEGDCE